MHPLQLYFIGAAFLMLGLVVWLRAVGAKGGAVQMAAYSLFFLTTTLLEPLRANFLTLNTLVAPASFIGFGMLALYLQFHNVTCTVGVGRVIKGGTAA